MKRNQTKRAYLFLVLVMTICLLFGSIKAEAKESYWEGCSSNYYYKQLSKEEKQIYNVLDKELNKLLTGKETLTQTVSNQSNTTDKLYYKIVKIPKGTVSKKAMEKVKLAIRYDNPQYYFVWRIDRNNSKSCVIYVNGKYADGSVRAKTTKKLRNKINAIIKTANKKKTDIEKLEYVYSKICKMTSYHTWDASKYNPMYVCSMDGPLLHGKGVCVAYADTFMAIANKMGYDSLCVGSHRTKEGHGWNQVKIKKNWYIVDATWGDDKNQGSNYKWFLISQKYAETIDSSGNHSKKYFDKGFKIPVAKKNYDKSTLILSKADLQPEEKNEQEMYTPSIPLAFKDVTTGEYYPVEKSKQGTLETIYYNTKDYYKNDGQIYRKKANVYLPNGYYKNKSKKYPILYYMHGTKQSEEAGKRLVNLFDQMIAAGWIEPMIVVFPTFYTNNPDKDNSIGYHNQDAFRYEFRNELMKEVEGKYRTYANSTSDADLIASRDYRAFAGLSAGGFVTWHTFLDNAEYVKYYIPLSGFLTNMYDENGIFITHDKMLKKAIQKAQELQNKGISYRIIECCGTNDCQMTEKTQIQCDTLTQHQDVFSKDKYVMLWIKDASHENRAWDEGLFSALPQFFPGKNYKIKF